MKKDATAAPDRDAVSEKEVKKKGYKKEQVQPVWALDRISIDSRDMLSRCDGGKQ
jgi:hypothetical protein